MAGDSSRSDADKLLEDEVMVDADGVAEESLVPKVGPDVPKVSPDAPKVSPDAPKVSPDPYVLAAQRRKEAYEREDKEAMDAYLVVDVNWRRDHEGEAVPFEIAQNVLMRLPLLPEPELEEADPLNATLCDLFNTIRHKIMSMGDLNRPCMGHPMRLEIARDLVRSAELQKVIQRRGNPAVDVPDSVQGWVNEERRRVEDYRAVQAMHAEIMRKHQEEVNQEQALERERLRKQQDDAKHARQEKRWNEQREATKQKKKHRRG